MKISTILSLSMLLLSPFFPYAQKKYLEASITTNDGQKIKGQVRAGRWNDNSYAFKFINSDGSKVTYTVPELRSFEVEMEKGNVVYFERKAVEIETSPDKNNVLELDESPELKYKRDTSWLELLYRGNWELFALSDRDSKQHFFINLTGEQPKELVRKLWRKGNRVEEVKLYKKQLLDLSHDCPQLFQFITNMDYSKEQFLQACKQYDACKNTETVYAQPKQRSWFSGYVFGGYSSAKLEYFSFIDRTLSRIPGSQAGVAIEYFPDRSKQVMSVTASASLQHFRDETSVRLKPSDLESSMVTYENWLVNLNLLFSYRFLVHKEVRPVFSLGFLQRIPVAEDFYSVYPGSGITTDHSRREDLNFFGFEAAAGIEYRRAGLSLRLQDFFSEGDRQHLFSSLCLNISYRIF